MLSTTASINIDLQRPSIIVIHAKQFDALSRFAEIHLFSCGEPWSIDKSNNYKKEYAYAVQYRKPDGTKGLYDKLPDGETDAVTESLAPSGETVLRVRFAPQMFTVAGNVKCSVAIMQTGDGAKLQTCSFDVLVAASEVSGDESKDYYKMVTLEGLQNQIGDLDGLATDAKSDLVAAINEVLNTIGGGLNAVHYSADSGKSEAEKSQARNNIDAQERLTAGHGISIDGNVISAPGGGGLHAVTGLDIDGAMLENYFDAESANVTRGKYLDDSGVEASNASFLYYSLPKCVRGRTYRTGTSYIYSVFAEDSAGTRTPCIYERGSGKRTFTVPEAEADGERIVKVYISLTAVNFDATSDKSVIDITERSYQDVEVPWLIAKSAKNVVQEAGNGTDVVISQKVTTELLAEKVYNSDILDRLNIGAEPGNFFVDYTGHDPNPIQYEKYIDANGNIVSFSDYLIFPITLYGGKTYTWNTTLVYGNKFVLYDSDGTVKIADIANGRFTAPTDSKKKIVTVYASIPQNSYNSLRDRLKCELTEESRYSGEKSYVPWIKTGNQWAGKNYLVIGDSVSAGTAPTGLDYSVVTETFSKIAADNLSMHLKNTAVQGRTVRTTLKTAQTGQSVMQDAIDAGFNPDLITILLGFNDYAAISRGEMTLGSDEDVYTTPETCSYYAGLREIVKICQKTWKEATIIILTSNKCVKYHRKGHEVQTIKEIEAVKKEIAENYGVLFFDWTNICGFNTEDENIVSYFRLDDIHPNREAHRVLGNRLTGFISSV